MKNSKEKDDVMRRVDPEKKTEDASKKTTDKKDVKSDTRCYNCGAKGHIIYPKIAITNH